MTFKHKSQNFFRKRGLNIDRFTPSTHPLARRMKLFKTYQINTVLDVGGNVGAYGLQLREQGFNGEIISFEPMKVAFNTLLKHAKKDLHWQAFNFALGEKEYATEINISDNSYSSSILDMLPSHLQAAPASQYIDKETVDVKTLDTIFQTTLKNKNNIYLKIDTQGFEKNVLDGSEQSLQYINTIQIELSIVPLYKDASLFIEMSTLLKNKGYDLVSLEPGFTDPDTGEMLQMDGVFHRAHNKNI